MLVVRLERNFQVKLSAEETKAMGPVVDVDRILEEKGVDG